MDIPHFTVFHSHCTMFHIIQLFFNFHNVPSPFRGFCIEQSQLQASNVLSHSNNISNFFTVYYIKNIGY